MAVKRNSHTYQAEETHQDTKTPPVAPPSSSYRSRCNSWGSLPNDHPTASKDMGDSRSAERDIAPNPRIDGPVPPCLDSSRPVSVIAAASRTMGVAGELTRCHLVGASWAAEQTVAVTSTSFSAMVSRNTELSTIPHLGRPQNFGIVLPDIYRSSYPKPEDYDFLRKINLKTIVTLVKKDDDDSELQTFLTDNGIRQIVFNIKGTKKEAIPAEVMSNIVNTVMDQRNHPLLVHCNHGKHRTGCVIAALRRAKGWSLKSTLDEYETYAAPKIRECDVAYITAFQTSSLQGLVEDSSRLGRLQAKNFVRLIFFATLAMTVWTLSGSSLAATQGAGH
ncbi:tyrosine phosphatase family-domain-containing protein [Stachybotrys elegans]|uniref:diphosphoinositol-polyphosphate diphosphatase n=1 Tax=Stachybotrys elegans TaxID=80388 RepID=A0A8K0STT9_9HYPO|nr:tyrosine phosphatase family-domain-containing protein [Stachybotrys elegans]